MRWCPDFTSDSETSEYPVINALEMNQMSSIHIHIERDIMLMSKINQ